MKISYRIRRIYNYSLKCLRWVRYLTIIVARAAKSGNCWNAIRYIVHMLWATVGLPSRRKEYRLDLDGVVFYVEAVCRDIGPYGAIWIDNEYRNDRRFIPSGGATVLDIGAQVGFYTVQTASGLGGGRMYSVEPDPGSFSRLEKNVRVNNLNNVTLFNFALGAKEGTVYLQQKSNSAENQLQDSPSNGTVEVSCTTLDKFVETQNIESIDLLKLDTEGAERDILKNAREVALPRVKAAIIEIHCGESHVATIDNIMIQSGLHKVRRHVNNHFYLRNS